MPAVSENFADLLEPGLRKIYNDQFKAIPEMRSMLYNVQTADSSYEKNSSVGSFEDLPVFTGTISYDEIYQGYDVTYKHVEYAKGFKIERKLYDDDLYNIISKKPKGLAIAAARTKEKNAATVFNDAFSGSGTIVVSGVTVLSNSEGVSLCSGTHSSTAVSDVQSNSGTTALSATAVEATRILMAAYKDDRNNLISVQPDLLLVPRNLEETGWQIIATKGEVNSADNNANFHYGKYKLAVWDYLTDSTNWFMIDSAMMKTNLNWYDRISLEFNQDKSFDTFVAKYSVYGRWSYGWDDWRWLYGHNA